MVPQSTRRLSDVFIQSTQITLLQFPRPLDDDVIGSNQNFVGQSVKQADVSCQGENGDSIDPSNNFPSIFLVPGETDLGLDQYNSDSEGGQRV
ncbi:hypothetical protein SNE40_017438 [Patella caerulea]|uniref:Uncharacterized protein n=1 Tax=Patella caerulea TaxID=87958 RepID=A0AAN8JHC5_PATCE